MKKKQTEFIFYDPHQELCKIENERAASDKIQITNHESLSLMDIVLTTLTT